MSFKGVKVFATPGTDVLGERVCQELDDRLPSSLKHNESISLGKYEITKFSNENFLIQLKENVRGYFTVVIHSQEPQVSDNLIILFALLDALKNSKAKDILIVFPYMPYARSDRKNQPRISTMAAIIPRIIQATFGLQNLIFLDPHDTHTKHYIYPSADEISSLYLFADDIKRLTRANPKEWLLTFPDATAKRRNEKLIEIVGINYDYIDKYRPDNTQKVKVTKTIFAKGKKCIIIDDEICSGGTLLTDAALLKASGAKFICAYLAHGVLRSPDMSDAALMNKLSNSAVSQFVVTDSINCRGKIKKFPKFRIITIAGLLAEAIKRTIQDDSLTALHEIKNVKLYRCQD